MTRASLAAMAGVRLIALALFRSLRRRRLRTLAALAAGVCGFALTTAVFVVSWSVLDAIGDVKLTSVERAGAVAVARSSSGMDAELTRRIQHAVPRARVAPVMLANTHLIDDDGSEPFLLVGATTDLYPLLATAAQRQMARLPDLRPSDVYVTAQAAREHRLRVGDRIGLQTPGGVRRWRVAGLIAGSFANRGAVAFTALPFVARAFARPATIDMVLVGRRGLPPDARERLERVTLGAATIVPPDRMTEGWTKSFRSLRGLLAVFALLALTTAAGVQYFAWRLTIEEERLNIARLCLVGANRMQLGLAALLLAVPVLLVSLLIGGPLGLVLGASLSGFTDQLVTLAQLAAHPQTPVVKPLVATALAGTLTLTLAWIGAMAPMLREPLTQSIAANRAARPPLRIRWIAAAGVTGGAVSAALLSLPFATTRAVAGAGLLLVLLAASAVGPVVAGRALSRGSGWTTIAAGRELAHGIRRSAALIAVFALAAAMSIGLSGASDSLRDQMRTNVQAWTRGDLFVDAAPPGENLQDDKLAPGLRRIVARAPGVDAVASFSYSLLDRGDQRVSLWSWGSSGGAAALDRFVRLHVVDGPGGEGFWHALDRGGIGVSTNFARLNHFGRGDTIVVPGRTRGWRLRIAAVVDDLVSDGGVLFVSGRRYRQIAGDARPYQLAVALAPGADVGAARRFLHEAVVRTHPDAVVWDRDEIRTHFGGLTAGLLRAFGLVAQVLFLLALLIGATSIAASVQARRRSLAIERLVGCSRARVRRQLVLEHVCLGVCAWVVAVPIGAALVVAIANLVALATGLLPRLHVAWTTALAMAPATLGLVLLALAVATLPRAALPEVAPALADE